MRTEKGELLWCTRCGRKLLLPFSNAEKTEVSIVSMEGWTAPPLICPACIKLPAEQAPVKLPDDPHEALKEIASYLRTLRIDREREVLNKHHPTFSADTGADPNEVLGYWQRPEWLGGLLEIAGEAERLVFKIPLGLTDCDLLNWWIAHPDSLLVQRDGRTAFAIKGQGLVEQLRTTWSEYFPNVRDCIRAAIKHEKQTP